MQSLNNHHTAASSVSLWVFPLFGLWETCSSLLSSFVFLSLHFAGWRWGIDQKQNGWAVLQDPPVLTDFKAGWVLACATGCGCAWQREWERAWENVHVYYACRCKCLSASVPVCQKVSPPCQCVSTCGPRSPFPASTLSLWNNSAKCFPGVFLCCVDMFVFCSPCSMFVCLKSPICLMSSCHPIEKQLALCQWYW